MIFSRNITESYGGSINSPSERSWKLKAGILKRLEITFPPGSQGLMGVSVFYYDQQIFPFDRGQWLKGNRIQISGNVDTEIKAENTELIIKVYNSDIVYDHEFSIAAEVSTEDESGFQVMLLQQLQIIITELQLIATKTGSGNYSWVNKDN